MILFLFVVNILMVNGVKVWSKPLNDFQCNKWSPLDEAYVSKTNPPVAITHIFCGQLDTYYGTDGFKIKAEGFHARPDNKNPKSAKIDTPIDHPAVFLGNSEVNCPFRVRARDVKVLYAKNDSYIARSKDLKRKFIFFPPSWAKTCLVNQIISVFNECKDEKDGKNGCKVDRVKGRISEICKENYTYQGCSKQDLAFKIFLSWQGNHYRVVTAFPDVGCYCSDG